jgi:phenylpropionate dioxygenase-like ring-hydroxylating dioxygenase large terminal subunit
MTTSTMIWRPPAPSNEAIASLVQDGRVHSRIYTDPTIFDLEIERIFQTSWIYIGHESEVPKVGDFQARTMGRTPVLMVRGRDHKVRVLINRCRHRGAAVVETESGNTKMLRCWYHGWVYDLSGALREVSEPGGYGPEFKPENMGLSQVPRVASHRGFLFGSLKPEGESLAQFLGGAAAQFDMLVDASPTGEIFLDAGVNKTEYQGNWKLVGMDGYHPNFVHASVVAGWARNAEAGIGAMHREDPFSDAALTLTRDYGNGHAMLDFRAQRLKSYSKHAAFLGKVPGGTQYVEDMHKAYGKERAELLISLSGDPHLGVFPNLQLIGNQVRIIVPVAPNVTQVIMSMVRLGGVSDEINTMRVRQHESFYGPAGSGSPDDAEIFERVQRGMQAEFNPWIEISRGMHREYVDTDGSVVGRITDEVPQRGQMKFWLRLMTESRD